MKYYDTGLISTKQCLYEKVYSLIQIVEKIRGPASVPVKDHYHYRRHLKHYL